MPFLLAVMGPTACGKSDLAETLADRSKVELINADAFQAYRGMDIGTAKPIAKERYRLLDIKDPNEPYGVGEFCMRAQKELDDLYRANRSAIVVGGTGLYIRALFEEYGDLKPAPDAELRSHLTERLRTEGLDALVAELLSREPQSKETVDLKNPVRVTRALERTLDRRPSIKVALPPFRRMKLGLSADISVLNERIEARTRSMVQNGWVQEVKRLLDEGYGPGDPGFEAIGYTELARYLEGRTDLEGAVATTIAETRRYAKRQRTWLRSEPNLTDLDSNDPDMVSVAVGLIESL